MARVGGGGGVSAKLLVVAIVLALVSLAVMWSYFLGKQVADRRLSDAVAEGTATERQRNEVYDLKEELLTHLEGLGDAQAVQEYLAKLDLHGIQVDPLTARNVLMTLQDWNHRYSVARDQLQVRLTSTRTLAEATEKARDVNKASFERMAEEKKQLLGQLDSFLTTEVQNKEQVATRYQDEKTELQNEYETELNTFEKNKASTLSNIAKMEERANVVRRQIEYLSPVPTIRRPDGTIMAADWRTKKAIIDIGKQREVFEGLVFNVYTLDQQGRPRVKGKLQVMTVHERTSTCNVIQEDPVNPIDKGDSIQSPFIPIPEEKRFVVAGAFAPGSAYTREQLLTLVKLNGGVVQDHVDLFTDYLILGETTGVLDAEAAQAAVSEEQAAHELSITIIDYRDFISHIQR